MIHSLPPLTDTGSLIIFFHSIFIYFVEAKKERAKTQHGPGGYLSTIVQDYCRSGQNSKRLVLKMSVFS